MSCRSLKGRVCYRGDSAKSADGKVAFYQTLLASPASIVAANAVIADGLIKGHKMSTADAVKAYLQAVLNSIAETWVRLPREVWPAEWFNEDGHLVSGGQSSGYSGACTGTLRLAVTGRDTLKSIWKNSALVRCRNFHQPMCYHVMVTWPLLSTSTTLCWQGMNVSIISDGVYWFILVHD